MMGFIFDSELAVTELKSNSLSSKDQMGPKSANNADTWIGVRLNCLQKEVAVVRLGHNHCKYKARKFSGLNCDR
jgi:hypothetical protein